MFFFFFSSRRRHTRCSRDWSSDVCSSDLGHVRGDVIYGYFTPRAQAILDLTLYIVFFIPGIVALTYAGYFYAAESWAINEHSNITAEGPPVMMFECRKSTDRKSTRLNSSHGY